MLVEKRAHPPEKNRLHPRNRHRERYDFSLLTQTCPELADFLKMNIYGDVSVDFADPAAVKMLNTALLKQYYDLNFWDIPPGYLCPPIPGRADYIHHIADVLAGSNNGIIPTLLLVAKNTAGPSWAATWIALPYNRPRPSWLPTMPCAVQSPANGIRIRIIFLWGSSRPTSRLTCLSATRHFTPPPPRRKPRRLENSAT